MFVLSSLQMFLHSGTKYFYEQDSDLQTDVNINVLILQILKTQNIGAKFLAEAVCANSQQQPSTVKLQ